MPLVYVLPRQILARAITEEIIYQPERASPSTNSLHARGSLEAWRYEVAEWCAGNPFLTFSIAAALAAPL